MTKLFVLLFLSAFSHSLLFAEFNACISALRNLEKGQENVRVIVKGQPKSQLLTYHGESEDGASFVFENNDESLFTFPQEDLFDFRVVDVEKEEAQNVEAEAFNLSLTKKLAIKIAAIPKKKLFETSNYIVFGPLRAFRTQSDIVVFFLEDADKMYKKLGFKIPPKTRLIIDSQKPFFKKIGPFFFKISLPTIYDSTHRKTLYFQAIKRNIQVIYDQGVITHERAHSILNFNFSRYSFINKNSTLQEAFADIFAAHLTNDPTIATNAIVDGKPIRNLESVTAEKDETFHMRSSAQAIKAFQHNTSLLYSGALWELRNKMEVEDFGKLLLPLINALNISYIFYDSNYLKRINNDYHTQLEATLEYFFAVLLNELRKKTPHRADNIIREILETRNFNFDDINNIARRLP